MTVVLVFFAGADLLNYPASARPNAGVLALVLTLFSAIQARRIEKDRSTLRGLLSAVGNWLIVPCILPTLLLAVALAFGPSRIWAVIWAGTCIGLQLIFELAMWRGPLSAVGSTRQEQHQGFKTRPWDRRHSEVLRSDWLRKTTAEALMPGP